MFTRRRNSSRLSSAIRGLTRFGDGSAGRSRHNGMDAATKHESGVGFFWLAAFYFVNCARPGDLVHVFGLIPLAKLTAICAVFMLFVSAGSTNRSLRDLPRESTYLLGLILLLFLS